MSIAPTRKSQSERTDEALRALKKTALELIVSEGINSLKITDVGVKAGYSRSIVNYHYGTKNELLGDLLDDTAKSYQRFYSQAGDAGLSTLEGLIDNNIKFIERQPKEALGLLLLIHEATGSSDKSLRERLVEYNVSTREVFQGVIRAILDKLPDNNKNEEDLAILILSMIRGVHSLWLAERDSFDIIQALRSIKMSLPSLLGMSTEE